MIFINTYSHNVRKYRLKKPYYHHYLCCYSTLHEEKPQIPFYANPSVWLMDDASMIELVFHLVGCWLGGEGVRWDEPRIMWKLYSIYMPSDTDPFLWNLIWNNQLNNSIYMTYTARPIHVHQHCPPPFSFSFIHVYQKLSIYILCGI